MPYENTGDLPDRVKNNLPKAAQEIYMEAYNSAHEEYKNPEKRRGDASLEETAAKVAWAAVKKKFEKSGDEWHKRRERTHSKGKKH